MWVSKNNSSNKTNCYSIRLLDTINHNIIENTKKFYSVAFCFLIEIVNI